LVRVLDNPGGAGVLFHSDGDRYMKQFEDLHIDDQNRLLICVLEKLAATSSRTIEDVAREQGETVNELWCDICAETGLDVCQPWRGYPDRPTDLPPARGGHRPLSDEQLAALSELSKLTNRPH
jgi:hypothetical protein